MIRALIALLLFFVPAAAAAQPVAVTVTRNGDQFVAEFNSRPASDPFWNSVIADPQRDTMFQRAVYRRGAITLQALRDKIGDDVFFRVLRTWTAEHFQGNATTAQFIALSERISGQDLSNFFQVWLYTPSKPTTW